MPLPLVFLMHYIFKMKIIYSILVLIFTISISSCSTTEELVKKEEVKEIIVKKAKIDTFPGHSPLRYNIESLSINGNVISISVNFFGGCEDQDFELIGKEEIKEGSIPERKIKLVPSELSSGCKQWLNKTVHFDISDFAVEKEDGFHSILLLDGYPEYISFYYQGF